MRDCLGQARDGEIGRRVALHDRRHDDRGHKRERCQQADMALAKTFVVSNLGECGDTTQPEVFNPSPGCSSAAAPGKHVRRPRASGPLTLQPI